MIFSEDPAQSLVTRRALSASTALFDHLFADLVRRIRGETPENAVNAALRGLVAWAEPIANLLTDAPLAAWLVGAGGLARQLPPGRNVTTPPRDFWQGLNVWMPTVAAAAKSLESRALVTRPEWERMTEDSRRRAFTVAGVRTREAVGKVREALVAAVREGISGQEFQERVRETVEGSQLGPHALENTLRTNVSREYRQGMEAVANSPLSGGRFIYRKREPIRDSRLTELCAALSKAGIQGTAIYRADDPFWIKTQVPSHFSCRDSVRIMTIEDAARAGIKEAIRWLKTGVQPTPPAWVQPIDITRLEGYVRGWFAGAAA